MIKEEYWLCNDGIARPISDLTEEHVKNILRKLIRDKRIIKHPVANANKRMMEEARDNISYYGDYLSWKDN